MVTSTIHLAMSDNMLRAAIFPRQAKTAVKSRIVHRNSASARSSKQAKSHFERWNRSMRFHARGTREAGAAIRSGTLFMVGELRSSRACNCGTRFALDVGTVTIRSECVGVTLFHFCVRRDCDLVSGKAASTASRTGKT